VRPLWTIVSFFAVVHLLALMLFGAWMWRTGRLSAQRLREARDIFAPTLAEEARQAAEQDAAARRNAAAEVVPVRLSSLERLNVLTSLQDQEQQISQRLQQESEMLTRQFEQLNARIEAEREAFDAQRQSWEEATRAERERKADEQFAQTVRQYESLPPRQGKELLIALVGAGRRDQAVAYLDAMSARAASRILREFKSAEELVLATELLEELRSFGLGLREPESPADDDAADTAGDGAD